MGKFKPLSRFVLSFSFASVGVFVLFLMQKREGGDDRVKWKGREEMEIEILSFIKEKETRNVGEGRER